jgi:exosortase A-associated hydrolase 2
VVVPDLFGTGDSAGDFAQADCQTWLGDLASVETWLQSQGGVVSALLGIRSGCLLAARYARQRAATSVPLSRCVFWQPSLDGARVLEQFLRLRIAASMMTDKKETVAELKTQLAAGAVVEVAGYGISQALATQLEQFKLLDDIDAATGRLCWFEVLRSADAAVPMPTERAVKQLAARGLPVELKTCVGEPFWTTTEIVTLPDLLDATVQALGDPP